MSDGYIDSVKFMFLIISIVSFIVLGLGVFLCARRISTENQAIYQVEEQYNNGEITKSEYDSLVNSIKNKTIKLDDIVENIIPAIKELWISILCFIFAIISFSLCKRKGLEEAKMELIRTFNSIDRALDYCNTHSITVPDISKCETDKYNIYQLRVGLDTEISFFQYLFKLKDLKNKVSLVSVPRYKDIVCTGKVIKQNGYYVIGKYYLKRGIVTLKEDTDIELHISALVSELDSRNTTCIVINNYKVDSIIYK